MLSEIEMKVQKKLEAREQAIEQQIKDWLRRTYQKIQDSNCLLELRHFEEFDSSGDVVANYDKQPPQFEDVGEMFAYYNGQWKPTFESGFGKQHLTVGNNFTEFVCDVLREGLEEDEYLCCDLLEQWECDLNDFAQECDWAEVTNVGA